MTDNIKYFSFKFLFFLYFVLFIGRGSELVANSDIRTNPIGMGLLIVGTIYFFSISKKNPITSSVRIFIFVLVSWIILHMFMLDADITPFFYVGIVVHSFSGLALVKCLGREIIDYYVKAIVLLAIISLALWGIQLVGGTNMLTSLPFVMRNIAGTSDYSLLLYTITEGSKTVYYGGLLRNSGCAWEPGLFSAMLVIGIVCRLVQLSGHFSIIDKKLFVLLFALASTLSTTGIMTVMILLSIHILISSRRKLGQKIVTGALAAVLFIWIYSLPFMSEKIEEKSDSSNFLSESSSLGSRDERFTVDRFEGMYLNYFDIIDKPVMGYGCNTANSYVSTNISPMIRISNGLTKTFAQMGIPLGLLMFVLLFYGCKRMLCDDFRSSHLLLFFAILIISVSYDFQINPIIKAIQFYPLLYTSKLFIKEQH